MQIDADTMVIEDILNIAINHEEYTEMFVASGVLYGITADFKDNLAITFALDLYTDEVLDVNLDLEVTTLEASVANYNHRRKVNRESC